MKLSLNEHQLQAVEHVDGPCLVTSCPGSGKCVVGKTFVCSHKKLISHIEDNEVGSVIGLSSEKLNNISSEEREISEFVNSGEQKTIKIITKQGYEIEGTHHHPIVTLDSSGDFKWKKLSEINEGDICPIWVNDKKSFSYEIDNKYYMLGLLYGDGCLVMDRTISFHSEKNNLANKFCKIIKELYNYNCKIEKDNRRESLYAYKVHSVKIMRIMKEEFGDIFHYAYDKRITSEILNASKSQIASLLRGIFDTDGYASDESCGITLSSKRLIDQIHILLLHYGVFSTKSIKKVRDKDYYRVEIFGNNYRRFVKNIGFGHEKKYIISNNFLDKKAKNSNQFIPFMQNKMNSILQDLSKGNFEWYSKRKQSIHFKNKKIRLARYRAKDVKNMRNITEDSIDRIDDIFCENKYTNSVFEELKESNKYCYSTVKEIVPSVSPKMVYDYVVPKTHSFVANGFINHNTFTLVERIARLIEKGVRPQNILCITFTNKAAAEMKERICKRLKVTDPGFFIGTFHSLCANILRKMGHLGGYPSNFTIIDDKEQFSVIQQVARRLDVEVDKGTLYNLLKWLNHYRGQQEDFSYVEERCSHAYELDIAKGYLDRCKTSRLVDFSALIYDAIQLIENCDDIREKLQNGFKYILVDETQDTNGSQYHLVELLGAKWNNIMLIGDTDQCVVEGESVHTPNGVKKIEDIEVGDEVLTGRGSGEIVSAKVLNKYEKDVEKYDIVKIKTKSGRQVRFSKEHIVFADFTKFSPKKIVVYLMFDKKLGYRVGVTNTARKYSINGHGGIGCRLNQERATCMWILKVCDKISDGKFWEQFYSVKYGIPTWCFYANGRDLDYHETEIEKMFELIDTKKNAKILMSDLKIDINRPHHQPKCMSKDRRRNFVINMCGDSRSSTVHRYAISGSDEQDARKLASIGLRVRGNGKGRKGWRVESAHKQLGDIYNIFEKVNDVFNLDVNVIEKIKLNDVVLKFMPASHLREGMTIYIENEGKVEIDEVVSVETHFKYTGKLYDIDVERYHNFITNGVFSHNSIYAFRGAKYKNLQNFIDTHKDCTVIPLSKNYRSTPEIIGAADKLIKHNTSHMGGKFETDNPSGEPVRCFEKANQIEEANWVAEQIRKLQDQGGWDGDDIAILYRMNKMSEPLEQALTLKGIPYEVIGSFSFYDRKEVKDIIAMVKFLVNKRDGIAFHRVCSIIPGLGDATIGKIENRAEDQDIDIMEATKDILAGSKSIKIKNACHKLIEVFSQDYSHSQPAKCVMSMISSFDYLGYLERNYSKNAIERKDNVAQIVEAASRFNNHPDGLDMYLQQISLVSTSDKEVEGKKVSLMSLHAAKGLEFPIVFMIGVEHSILPHGRAVLENEEEGIEEERRLCYVGVTRAKKVLYITHCKRRFGFGKFGNQNVRKTYPSRFLKEMGLISNENRRNISI